MKKNEQYDSHHKKIQEKLIEMYEELEDLEAQNNNIALAKMVLMNDIKRIPLLQNGRLKEASDVSLENDTKKTKKN